MYGSISSPGCWVAQWRVGGHTVGGVNFLQAVLNDGTTLPPLSNGGPSEGEVETVGAEGGCFTEVHGR